MVGLVRFLAGNSCIVPRVKARPLAAAKRAITRAGCRGGSVIRRFSATVKKGRVVVQKPHPGTRVAAPTTVASS
jgi:beta-lactam-binding protein with PASTA domain